MKHNFLFLILFCLVLGDLHAQMNKYYDEDSLRAILKKTTLDTVRVNILNNLAGSYFFKRPDSTLLYAEEALALARKLNYTTGIQYDIITKAHGGKLKVDSEEGKGCESIILLPLTKSA